MLAFYCSDEIETKTNLQVTAVIKESKAETQRRSLEERTEPETMEILLSWLPLTCPGTFPLQARITHAEVALPTVD